MNRTLAWLFVLLALPLGLFMIGVVPLGQIADEWSHLLRADSLLYGAWVGHHEAQTLPDGRTVAWPGVPTDREMLGLRTTPDGGGPEAQHAADLLAQRALRWRTSGPVFSELGPISGYFPIFYAPAAAAIGLAKLLGYGPFWAFLGARLVNVILYVLAGAAALLLARRGQAILFCTLLLPLAMDLGASLNQDGLMLAATSLAAALLTRTAPPVTFSRAYWGAALLLACVILVKPPYLPICAMLLLPLPPRGQWRGQRRDLLRRVAIILLIALACLAWTVMAQHAASFTRIYEPHEAGPLYPGPRPAVFGGTDMAAQLRVLLADPTRVITLPAVQLWRDHLMLYSMVGRLGWQNVDLPLWLTGLWLAALAAAAAMELTRRGQPGAPRGWADALLLLLAAVVAVDAIFLSQYLVWTEVGVDRIDGPQGRYMLPLLPLLAFAVPRLGFPAGRAIRATLWLLPLAAAAIDLFMLPRVLVEFYYMG